MIGLYTGASVDALTALPGTPRDTGYEEIMTVAVLAGTTYYIQAAGYNDSVAGNILLTWTFVGTGGYDAWAVQNAGGGAADEDYNNDGVQNGIAYFMGNTGNATNPGVVGNKVAWPHSADAIGITYRVLTSVNLGAWTDVTADAIEADGFLTYTLPKTTPKLFVRLEVVTP
jgi:hypothetical protein